MGLKKIIKIIYTYISFIIGLMLLGAIIGLASIRFLPAHFEQSQLFFVTSPQTHLSNYYPPAYFAQESARDFTDTAVALLQAPEFYRNIASQNVSVDARKVAPQLIEVTIRSPQKRNLENALENIPQSFNTKVEEFTQSTSSAKIRPIAAGSKVTFFAINRATVGLAGSMAGLMFAVFIIGLKTYFKL